MTLLTGNLSGIFSRKPIGFFPVFAPSPCKGEGNRKTEVGISGQRQQTGKQEKEGRRHNDAKRGRRYAQ